jgi:hypothetical protein
MGMIASLAAAWLAAGPTAAAPSPAACGLAQEVVARYVTSHPMPPTQLVAPRVKDLSQISETSFTPWKKGQPAPPPALARAYLKRGETSVLACANVRELLDANGVGYGAEAQAGVEAFFAAGLKPHEPAYTLHYISLPVVSGDGRAALVSVGSRCKGLCGHWAYYYYVKGADGRWVAHQVGPLILS